MEPIDLGELTQEEIDALLERIFINSDSIEVEGTTDKVIFRMKGYIRPVEDSEG